MAQKKIKRRTQGKHVASPSTSSRTRTNTTRRKPTTSGKRRSKCY